METKIHEIMKKEKSFWKHLFLEELVKENRDKLICCNEVQPYSEKKKKYMSVFDYSIKYGGIMDSYRYYNNYRIELGEY